METKPKYDFLAGETLLINKPLTWTSFDVVNKIRYAIKNYLDVKKIKVGHAGTLDPLADGLLILCTGKMTKQIDTIQAQVKEYTGIITLGATTPSYDLESEFDKTFDCSNITEEEIAQVAHSFLGEQEQLPPAFSAKKVNGKKAYELARKGKEVDLKKSLVTISEFEVTKIEDKDIHFRIVCSKGTYIRSIAHDFGLRLNNGAHLSKLRRTKIGEYTLESAMGVDDLCKSLTVML